MLQALQDPLLVRSPQEVFAVIKPTASSGAARRPLVLDWFHLNLATTALLAILVFAATLVGILVAPNNHLVVALTTAGVFALLYVCLRANVSKSFSSIAGQLNVVARKPRAY